MIARWSDEEPGTSTTAGSLRRARRAVAEALLPASPPVEVERRDVSLAGAWLAAGWGLLVVVAYLARLGSWWGSGG